MKKIFALMLFATVFTLAAHAQKPSFCYAYASNAYNKVAYVSKVLDPDNFDGSTWSTIQFSIKDAFKKAVAKEVGTKAYEYSQVTIESTDQSKAIFTNNYDAATERKKLIAKLQGQGYTVIQLDVQ